MLPLLRLAGDGKEHVLADARSRLGSELKLTQAELDELLPSGGQTRFANRVAWAKVYLERGGLLESPQRGRFIISRRGREVLNAQPVRIDVKFLTQYPEFGEFQKAKRQTDEPTTQLITPNVADAETPEEELEAAHGRIEASLAAEVLARVKAAPPGILRAPRGGSASEDGIRRLPRRRRPGHWQGRR